MTLKKIYVILLSVIFIIGGCMLFTACFNKDASNVNLSADLIMQYLGEDMTEVIQKLNIDTEKASVTEHGNSEIDLQLENVLIDENQTGYLTLSFYNNTLCYIRYDLANSMDAAYEYTKKLYNKYQETYGDAITYEDLPNRIKNLDSAELLNSADNFVAFKEEWNIENENISNKVFNGNEIKLELSVSGGKAETGEQTASITIRCFER